jgi:hypothetical protein
MSKIIATVNEGTRLTNGRIRKFIPDLAVWAVPGLLIDVKAKGPRNVNGVRITYVDASQPLNTNSTHYGVFIISQDEESIQAAADEAAAEVAKTNEIHAAHDRAAATVASVDDANGAKITLGASVTGPHGVAGIAESFSTHGQDPSGPIDATRVVVSVRADDGREWRLTGSALTVRTEPVIDPVEFDTKLAELHKAHDVAEQLITTTQNKIHTQAGDKQRYEGRRRVWGLTLNAATEIVQRQAAQLDRKALALLSDARTLIEKRDELAYDIDRANDVYRRAPWSRFFPSITKSHPHIHATLGCRTLHATTEVSWAPSLSGTTEAEAVAQLDEALCSVCFPSAPVALHNYTSKRSQAERDARAAEKIERDAKRAAKTLTEDEEFRTSGRDRVTTVAECLRLIRQAVEDAVAIEYWDTDVARERWTGDAEGFDRIRLNASESYVRHLADAELAEDVLTAREARTAGHGATWDAIAKIKENKLKSARKEWLS